MTRQPEDLAAPPNQRPPHINPQWWYRATWHARQQAINAHNQQTRHRDALRANVETARTHHQWNYQRNTFDRGNPDHIAQLLDAGITCQQIADGLLTTLDALETAMRRAGRRDLSRDFWRARAASTCVSCGKATSGPDRCKSCAARVRETARWAKARGEAA